MQQLKKSKIGPKGGVSNFKMSGYSGRRTIPQVINLNHEENTQKKQRVHFLTISIFSKQMQIMQKKVLQK